MGLFKDIYCVKCGKKCNVLTRTKLLDGNYLCYECTERVPSFIQDKMSQTYTLEDYEKFMAYVKRSDREFKPVFMETHRYYEMHLDSEHGLFYIGGWKTDTTVFWELHTVEEFDLVFSPDSYKEGIIGDTVKGKVLLRMKTDDPYFYYEKILTNSARAKAKKSFFGTKLEYEDPKDMSEFELHFNLAYKESVMKYCGEQERASYEEQSYGQSAATGELQQALMVFMLDDVSDMTLEQLQIHRKRLLKVFHPDNGSDTDNKYAQKINAAYEIIKKYLEAK